MHGLATISISTKSWEMDWGPSTSYPTEIKGLNPKALTFVLASNYNQSIPYYKLVHTHAHTSVVSDISCSKDSAISFLQYTFQLHTGNCELVLSGTTGLLFSHSSLPMKGIIVHAGVILTIRQWNCCHGKCAFERTELARARQPP